MHWNITDSNIKDVLLSHLTPSGTALGDAASEMQVDVVNAAPSKAHAALIPKALKDSPPFPDPSACPEHELYLSLLVLLFVLSRGPNQTSTAFELSDRLVTNYLPHYNRRSLDPLAAKIWFYHSRVAEMLELSGEKPQVWGGLRSKLMSAHRTARLRRDEDSEATLLNLIIRNLLGHELWEQADRLVGKTEFPDFGKTEASVGAGGMVPSGQVARWLYYLGESRMVSDGLGVSVSCYTADAFLVHCRADSYYPTKLYRSPRSSPTSHSTCPSTPSGSWVLASHPQVVRCCRTFDG